MRLDIVVKSWSDQGSNKAIPVHLALYNNQLTPSGLSRLFSSSMMSIQDSLSACPTNISMNSGGGFEQRTFLQTA